MWDPESNNEDYHNALLTADWGMYSLLWNQKGSYMSVQTLSIWSAWPQSQGYLTFRKENKHLPRDPCFLTFNSAQLDIIHAGKLLTNSSNFFKPKSKKQAFLGNFNNFFFFFWWQIRTVDIYQHAQRQIRGQVTSAFHQFYSQNFMIAIKFWFLLERKIHLLSLDKKCMLSKQKTTTNLLSSSSFSKFVLIVELILPISTTASSSWPWRNKTQS